MIISGTIVTLMVTVLTSEVKGQGCDPYLQFGSDHTMCRYNEKTCSGKTLRRYGPLSCQEKQTVLNSHNVLRQSVALGLVTGQPKAQNMAEMVWDDELAKIAERWAEQCSISHDSNRKVGRFAVGQNVLSMSVSPKTNDLSSNFTRATKLWFNEVYDSNFNPANIAPFVGVAGTLHYSQLVWATSYALGCAFVAYDDATYTNKLYVCNYGPRGNTVSGTMYVTGSPNCGTFSGLSDSPRYSGLCVVSGSNPPNTGCSSAGEEMIPWFPGDDENMYFIQFPFGSWEDGSEKFFDPSRYNPILSL